MKSNMPKYLLHTKLKNRLRLRAVQLEAEIAYLKAFRYLSLQEITSLRKLSKS